MRDPDVGRFTVDRRGRPFFYGPTLTGITLGDERRVGTKPDPSLLSNAAARDPRMIAWARGLQAERFTWLEVLAMYPTKGEADGDG